MSSKLLMTLFCCLIASTGCNLMYKQNVQQGNAIEQEKLEQLKTGMTMNQVAYLLGTPAVRDPFHQSRWDYIYTFAYRGNKQTSRHVTLYFENAILKEMVGVEELEASAADINTGEKSDNKTDLVATEASSPEPEESAQPEAIEPEVTGITTPPAASSAPEIVVDEADDAIPVTDTAAPAVEIERSDAPLSAPAEFVKPLPEGIPLAENDPTGYVIQLGAFDSLGNARSLVDQLRGSGFDVAVYMQVVEGLGPRFLVRSPAYDSKTEGERQMQQINSEFNLDGFLIVPSSN